MPPIAMTRKLTVAAGNENAPVNAAAIANLKATRPEASFMSASPSSRCIRLLGSRIRPARLPTATASVGDKIAASPNDTAGGTDGIIQWMA